MGFTLHLCRSSISPAAGESQELRIHLLRLDLIVAESVPLRISSISEYRGVHSTQADVEAIISESTTLYLKTNLPILHALHNGGVLIN